MFEDYNGNNGMTNIPKAAKIGGGHNPNCKIQFFC